jgi:tripartite ATP-independent transporter DctP family solute receptor
MAARLWKTALGGLLMTLSLGPVKAAEVTIRWGDVVSGSHPAAKMIERIAADVSAKTNGRIAVQGFADGQLGGSRDMIEAVSTGVQHIVTEGAANFGQWVPSISVVESPYVWRDAAHLTMVLSGPIGAGFNDQLVAKRGMRILGWTYYGTRHLTTTAKEVKSVADVAGLKIRVPENDVFRAMVEAWGAKPTPINFGELYLALKQGVVDGEENPLPTIRAGKFDEVQKYIVLTGHIITPRVVVVNEAFWKGLKPADRDVIQAAVNAGVAWHNEQILQQEKDLLDTFKKAGVTIVQPDVASFSKPVLDKLPKQFEARWGAGVFEKIRAVQ